MDQMVNQGRQTDPKVNQILGGLTCEAFSSRLYYALELCCGQ